MGTNGGTATPPFAIVGMVLLPFVIGILTGLLASFLMKCSKNNNLRFALLLLFLCVSTLCGLLIDRYIFHAFRLNYLLIGMVFSTTIANALPEKELSGILNLYNPLLNLSLIIVIVNLGMPLDYRLIAGAGLFTVIYILSRAVGKIAMHILAEK